MPLPETARESDEAPSDVPRLISRVYEDAPESFRRKLLVALLRPVGPLAMAAIAAGAFGSFLHRRTWWQRPEVSIDDVSRFSADHIFELARYIEQSSPEVIAQIGLLVADGVGAGLGVLSATLLLHALRRRSQSSGPPPTR